MERCHKFQVTDRSGSRVAAFQYEVSRLGNMKASSLVGQNLGDICFGHQPSTYLLRSW